MKDQTNEEFLKSWGYLGDVNQEKHSVYQQRTAMAASLLAAVWITSNRRDEQAPHPFGIDNCWKFLVNVVSSPPESLCLHLLDKILEVAGSSLHSAYNKQFVKLILVLRDQYLPVVNQMLDEDTKAAFERLRNERIGKFFSENRFETPRGKLAANFW